MKATSRIRLSVVVPALNEAENIQVLLPRLKQVVETLGCAYEIIVVDGDSRDGTGAEVQKFAREARPGWASTPEEWCRVTRQSSPGYGEALKRGLAGAGGDLIATMDADLSHAPGVIADMVATALASKADVVIASRYVQGGRSEAPLFRTLFSKTLNRFFAWSLDLPYRDLSSGFRLYRRGVLDALDLEADGYEILEELLVKLHVEGYRIAEMRFLFRPRRHGASHAKIFAFGLRYLCLLPKLRKLRFRADASDHEDRAYFGRAIVRRWRCARRLDSILKHSVDFGRILDLGCGSDLLIDVLPNSVGADVNLGKLRYKRAPGRHLVQCTGCSLPFGPGSFSQVVCSNVLEHVDASAEAGLLAEVSRVLRPGGALLLCARGGAGVAGRRGPRIRSIPARRRYARSSGREVDLEGVVRVLRERKLVLEERLAFWPGEVLLIFRSAASSVAGSAAATYALEGVTAYH